MKVAIDITVNGDRHQVEVEPRTTLLQELQEPGQVQSGALRSLPVQWAEEVAPGANQF